MTEVQPIRPEPPNPEDLPANRKRIERELRDACSTGGLDIVPAAVLEELVGVVVAECSELRERVATRILEPCIGRYECGGEGGLTDAQMEMLVTTVLYHYEDDAGVIQVLPEALSG